MAHDPLTGFLLTSLLPGPLVRRSASEVDTKQPLILGTFAVYRAVHILLCIRFARDRFRFYTQF